MQTVFALHQELEKNGYNHFYCNMGAKPIGVASGIFDASKYKISSPEFIPFPHEMLVRRTKKTRKGVYAFDIESQGIAFAKIFTSHMQNSKKPQFPNVKEVTARKMQMDLILKKMAEISDRCVIITRELNLDDQKYNTSTWNPYFYKKDEYKQKCHSLNTNHCLALQKTWEANGFFASFTEKTFQAL
ncbi:MAG: hypothetical protein K2Y01_01740 [Rhabdochlamydiaceae bacterium]|nr:hypothetical protein [Rhabdochlamydiaceae bacterium]